MFAHQELEKESFQVCANHMHDKYADGCFLNDFGNLTNLTG